MRKRRGGQLGQAPGDLGLAHPGGADHDDILRGDLVPEVLGDLLAPPAVPQGDGHRALGVLLPHDVFVQLRHGLPGGQMIPGGGEQLEQFHGCLPLREAISCQRSAFSRRNVGCAPRPIILLYHVGRALPAAFLVFSRRVRLTHHNVARETVLRLRYRVGWAWPIMSNRIELLPRRRPGTAAPPKTTYYNGGAGLCARHPSDPQVFMAN